MDSTGGYFYIGRVQYLWAFHPLAGLVDRCTYNTIALRDSG